MALGYLIIVTTTANGLQPVPHGNITITKPDSTFRFTAESGMDGRTKQIELETVDKSYSMNFESQQLPFQRYHVEVQHPGFNPSRDYIVDIFDGVVSTLTVNLIPALSQEVMPAHFWEKPVVSNIKNPNVTEKLPLPGSKIKIPLFITVKLGPPDSQAPVVQLEFIDYVKAVVSRLVYPTWPDDAVKTVINAVISNALRRLSSKHYEKLGYPFEITADGFYDQPYSAGRSIPVKVSRFVDEIFDEFVTQTDMNMPIRFLFSPYHQAQGLPTDLADEKFLDLWQVVHLANRGLNPLEIIQTLYGEQYLVPQCAELEGVSYPYPGKRLRIGQTGYNVSLMQHFLNLIADQYPTIPTIPKNNGVFDEAMKKAVEETQNLFFLEPTGMIDKKTWYRIYYQYLQIQWLRELQTIQYQMEHDDWSFPGELREGSHRYGVYQLQFMLNIIALFLKEVLRIDMDSRYGKETKQAVANFQKLFGLPVTGIVDEVTWNQIYDVYLRNAAVLPIRNEVMAYPEAPLTEQSLGKDVMAVQKLLNQIPLHNHDKAIPVSGAFDELTRERIMKFQHINQLPMTGTVDQECWDAIVFKYIENKKYPLFPRVLLKQPMSKNYVSLIQRLLNKCSTSYRSIPIVTENGIFDNSTRSALKAFQRELGLEQSGEIDKKSWLLLMDVANHSTKTTLLPGDLIDHIDVTFKRF